MASSASRLTLLIGDEGVLCVPRDVPGVPQPFFAAIDDAQSAAAIASITARCPKIPVVLLADTLALDVRRDSIPRINSFDRNKLIRRRMQQALPQAHLAASLPVKSDRGQILFAGLHGGGQVFYWLTQLERQRRVQPPRLGLLPVECTGMIAKLLPQSQKGWALLLSRQRTGGFRQIVTCRGEIIFTRLTPSLSALARPAEIAETVARDIAATRTYLGRLGLDERGDLPAVIILPETCHTALRAAALPLQAPLFVSPFEAAHRLGLPFAPTKDDLYGDLLFALWAQREKKLRLPLMPAEMQRAQATARMRRWGMRIAATAMIVALADAGWNTHDLFQTLFERENEASALDTTEKNLAREQAEADPITAPAGRLRQALERQRLFTQPASSPWPLLGSLRDGIDDDMRLTKLVWQNSSGKPEDETLRLAVRLTATPDDGDREQTVTRFRAMAVNLGQILPRYAVNVTHYPFPALPQEPLSNTQTDAKKADDTAEFSIARLTP